MLYDVFVPLIPYFTALNVFRYITFRAGYGMLTALVISFLFGPMIIRGLKRWQMRERIRGDGPPSHQVKAGTLPDVDTVVSDLTELFKKHLQIA